jgi:hypothetical protein
MADLFCRLCRLQITEPENIYTGWCPQCRLYQYEIFGARGGKRIIGPGIVLDSAIGDIQRELRYRPSMNSLVTFEIEPIARDGRMRFRALVKVNDKAVEYSRQEQHTPTDALIELRRLCMGTKPEDI